MTIGLALAALPSWPPRSQSMTARSIGAALLLLEVLGCSAQPLVPDESAARREAVEAARTAQQASAEAAAQSADAQTSRTALAVEGIEDVLARVLPAFADAAPATQLEAPLRALLEALRDGDVPLARRALISAESAIGVYASTAADAAVQAPELEVLRFALVQARAALAHSIGPESAQRSESSLPAESISKLEDPS
jgi:hypothetical protein